MSTDNGTLWYGFLLGAAFGVGLAGFVYVAAHVLARIVGWALA